jgi:hypothetical protein
MSLALSRGASQGQRYVVAGLPADATKVSKVLETTLSGTPVALTVAGNDYELLPTATFLDDSGRWCREFTASDLTAGQDTHALACRGDQDWSVELATTESHVEIVQDEGYFPAGADRTTKGRSPVDAATERRLIEAGWR